MKKPMLSVMAVSNTLVPTAGSSLRWWRTKGMPTPMTAATSRLSIIAMAMTMPKWASRYRPKATTPINDPHTKPLSTAMPNSLVISFRTLAGLINPRANERIIKVLVWVPVLPPIPATMGINEASATICSMVPSNKPMTRVLTKAVIRFIPNQNHRFFKLCQIPENKSSSSSKPA